jgi:hypothetical protein
LEFCYWVSILKDKGKRIKEKGKGKAKKRPRKDYSLFDEEKGNTFLEKEIRIS